MTPNKSNMDDAGDTKVSQVMNPENSTAGAGLQFNTTGLDPKEKILFVCSEAVECKFLKLETSRTVILPPTVSVLCY